MKALLTSSLGFLVFFTTAVVSAAADAPPATAPEIRAARSVHWKWMAPTSEVFYLEMIIDESVDGSYFMACGWDTGYFGLQQLRSATNKVAIFSVWDPTKGDDPQVVKLEDRVEVLHSHPAARIKRFGGEGTGGQCMIPFSWQIGQTNRFVIRGQPEGNKTAYSAYLFFPDKNSWEHLATFRTRTGGRHLRGLYSFVEDFRRDGRSAKERRSARFGQGWVQTPSGEWTALLKAQFTASGATWEARETIDATLKAPWLQLATGGATSTSQPLKTTFTVPGAGGEKPSLPFLSTNAAARAKP